MLVTIPDKWNQFTIEGIFKDYWQVPKGLIHEWRMGKEVFVNNQFRSWNSSLKAGECIQIPIFTEEIEVSVHPSDLQISILYEDEHVLIANKPAGLDTHPSSPDQVQSLLNGAAYHLFAEGRPGMIKHIHRLDRDTTGAVLFAKNRLAGSMLDKMLEDRKIKRTYVALCEGILAKNQGTISEKIGRDRHHATRRRVSPTGQTAVTHYQVLRRYPKKKLSVAKCSLESGRTHQIRVHFSHIGHPLAGDSLYGGKPVYPRQALHAYKIEFIHPITEETIVCRAPFLDNPPIFPDIHLP
ncbi:RluA family pseudouridine synthase [Peribacillus cavernae]|uniref:RluA family pseudouridine synthase n=1 Tax=Peribacillus cavernae TaxID=1674310 RepID=UPI001FE7E11F|nr:RluA family pseudouridine synthase [Peribacillus cavernae]MDQ0219901.1 23S rRNA pseudouridine1911/1915/1917 synthase [Peribacillus cavernae]